jgi:hypothetical protein
MDNDKRRLDYAHFGVSGYVPFVAWKYKGDASESRRTFGTMQEAQDAYNEIARRSETYGIMPTHEPVSAALTARLAEAEARAEKADETHVWLEKETARADRLGVRVLTQEEQLAATLARVREVEEERDALAHEVAHPADAEELRALREERDTARAEAVREFAAWADKNMIRDNHGNCSIVEEPTDAADRYLAQAGKEQCL